MEVRFRDRDVQGRCTGWRVGATGRYWAWHAALWSPRRFLAACVQNLGRDIHWCLSQDPPALESARRKADILAGYVERLQPMSEQTTREFQLVRRSAGDGRAEPIFDFSSNPHDHGP